MNTFVRDLATRIDQINTREDLALLYRWIWDHQCQVGEAATQINAALGLAGEFELKPDLPCLSVGSTSGLVVLAANPGWKPEFNALEDGYCRQSREKYVDMMFNFFERHPVVRGNVYSKWWSRAMKFITLLPGQAENCQLPKEDAYRWEFIRKSGILGGWELFPWHSSKDGVTSKTGRHPWLRDFFTASVNAILRLSPKVLLVASSAGYDLIRQELLCDLAWKDAELGGTKCSYAESPANTEIVAIKVQLLSGSSFRKFTDEEFVAKVSELRSTE